MAGLAILPWLCILAACLPATAQADHWDVAWAGLDGMEALGLLSTGALVRRRDGRAGLAAAATATVLLVDAWFDIITAGAGHAQLVAIAMAVFAEFPMAVLCAAAAVRSTRRAGRLAPGWALRGVPFARGIYGGPHGYRPGGVRPYRPP